MSDFVRILLLLLLVVSAAVLLCLLIPALSLLELFLVLLGGLILAVGMSLLNDLIHYHKVEQALREIDLERQRRQLLPPGHNQTSASHHNQGHSRSVRRGRCRW